jgi:hypothetical protein
MNIRPNRVRRGSLESAQAPLTPESGCLGYSPLDEARQRLIAANRHIAELESTLTSLHRLLLRKEGECDQLRKELSGTALPTPPTGPAISAIRAEKKKKRNRR